MHLMTPFFNIYSDFNVSYVISFDCIIDKYSLLCYVVAKKLRPWSWLERKWSLEYDSNSTLESESVKAPVWNIRLDPEKNYKICFLLINFIVYIIY